MRIHLIGIGGISMMGLAQYLVKTGHTVSGCDLVPVALPGIETSVGHKADHIADVDQIIISSAVTENSPAWSEYLAAQSAGIPIIKRAQAIGTITREHRTLTVSGMHGKSTTTGMLAHVLLETGKDPLVLIGAKIDAFGGNTFRWGNGSFVLEADEFDRSFHNFVPATAILTNIEPEHLDYYTGGLPEILESFAGFVSNFSQSDAHPRRLIVCGDDQNIRSLLEICRETLAQAEVQVFTYGFDSANDYIVVDSSLQERSNHYSIRERETGQTHTVALAVPGRHNQLNATAVFIAAAAEGVKTEAILTALSAFHGVGGRFDILFQDGPVVISDYGHHPTEVSAMVAATRSWYPGKRLVLAFQPHQYARTKLHYDDFVRALGAVDVPIVTEIFAVAGREEDTSVSGEGLARDVETTSGKRTHYVPSSELASYLLSVVQTDDVVLLMGAGRPIGQAARDLAELLMERD